MIIHQTQLFYDHFMFPNHIKEISYLRDGQENPFFMNMALKPSDQLNVYFNQNGEFIDASTVQLSLNSLPHKHYNYDAENGKLNINQLSQSSSLLSLNVFDIHNNKLPTTNIKFTLSDSTILLTTPLFYPNPYDLKSDLLLGFNLNTVPGAISTVTVYFFNSSGHLIHQEFKDKDSNGNPLDTGYHMIKFNFKSSFLAPGGYLVKLVARDDQGNQSIGTAKLGIH